MVFMNNLSYDCLFLKSNRSIFYSEYYAQWKSKIKNLLFYIVWFLFFRNKKLLVPHKLWLDTFKKISKNVFYLPQLYDWNVLDKPIKRKDSKVIFLFVWRISQYYKNVEFMISNFERVENRNCELLLAWKIYDIDDRYLEIMRKRGGNIRYLWEKSFSELEEVYQASDFLILPSKSEPIGSVVQEAMANGCVPIVSDLVWSEWYIDNWINGFTFKSNNAESFLEILNKCINFDKESIYKIKENAINKVKEKYWIKNKWLIDDIYQRFNTFSES